MVELLWRIEEMISRHFGMSDNKEDKVDPAEVSCFLKSFVKCDFQFPTDVILSKKA